MKRVLHEQMGRLCLVLALVWTGLTCVLFPPHGNALPDEASRPDCGQVQVAFESRRWILNEAVFPAGEAGDYRHEGLRAWSVYGPPPPPPPPPLEVPTRATIRPVVRLLPDPGPSLEGADRLPVDEHNVLPLRLMSAGR